jgi:YVTN family beta-propeller protein
VDALLLTRANDPRPRRLAVGRRPTAVVMDSQGRRAYVANTFADTVSVVDLAAAKVEREIPLGPTPALHPSDRGEQLFFDARLSHDGWLSCQSCHTDGHTNGRLNDNRTDGTFGTPKRVLSLLGVKDTAPWAWNGQMSALEKQVRTSIKSTMQGKAPSPGQVADLTAYLKTLTPAPSLERMGRGNPAGARRGQEVFARLGCAHCHRPPLYTSVESYDVGLADEAGLRHFNPPSLRGVSQGGPYFHDNRAAALADVFARHRHGLREPLPDGALRDLVDFLRSL